MIVGFGVVVAEEVLSSGGIPCVRSGRGVAVGFGVAALSCFGLVGACERWSESATKYVALTAIMQQSSTM